MNCSFIGGKYQMSKTRSSLIVYALLLLAGCASSASASNAIEAYIRALAEKDVVAATGGSCLAWEESAYAEASSFEAVEVTLEGLSCSDSGSQAEFTLVECEGKLVANYGGEILDIDLSQRTYLALNEQSEWKMCGYAGD
jgi:hypothetical protein